MKVILLVLFATLSSFFLSSQEELSPIEFKLPLNGINFIDKSNKIDSLTIYIPDTLTLPLFDEFSKNKFQNYQVQYSGPNVTQEKYFNALFSNNTPITTKDTFVFFPTFLYLVKGKDTTKTPLTKQVLRYADLSSYPVTYKTIDAYPPYSIYDTVGTADKMDTVYVKMNRVTLDSALVFKQKLQNPNLIWLDKKVFHNYNYAINPWSLGVVTFDGLNENFYPYNIGSNITGRTDELTSKPINLSNFKPIDSLYISFLYQVGGFGDAPESNDSLVLEWYNPTNSKWGKLWSKNGLGNKEKFNVVHIPIKNPIYFVNGFQFRLRSVGHQSGALDNFHVDYINFRKNSGFQDTTFKDFAFVYPVGSLVKNFQQVPYKHWKLGKNKMNDSLKVIIRNGSSIFENNQDGTVDIYHNNILENTNKLVLIGQKLSGGQINYAPRTTIESYHDFSKKYSFSKIKTGDEVTFDIKAWANAQFANFPVNDSSFSKQKFADVYAQDDGSAEKAYGLTAAQSRLAYRFKLGMPDTLIGIDLHFVPSVSDKSKTLFLLSVWKDNKGTPGELIFEDNIFLPKSPIYSDSINKFVRYYFSDSMRVRVDSSFFIGWRQIDATSLNLGFDANINTSKNIKYSLDGGATWKSSINSGSLMMRPVIVSNLTRTLATESSPLQELNWSIYPNPSNQSFDISADFNWKTIQIMSMGGQIIEIKDVNENKHEIEQLPAGVYLISIDNKWESAKKWIKI